MKFQILLLVVFLGSPGAHAQIRTFTDKEGQSVRGELIKVEGENITIRREDGRQFTFPIARLNASDQQSLRTESGPAPAASSVANLAPEPQEIPKAFKLRNQTVLRNGPPMRTFLLIAQYHKIKADNDDIQELFGKVSNVPALTNMLKNFGFAVEAISTEGKSAEDILQLIKQELVGKGPVAVHFRKTDEMKNEDYRHGIVLGYNDAKRSFDYLHKGHDVEISYDRIEKKAETIFLIYPIKSSIPPETTLLTVKSILERGNTATTYEGLVDELTKSATLDFQETDCNSHENVANRADTQKNAIKNGYRLIRSALNTSAVVIVPQTKDCTAIAFYIDPKTDEVSNLKLVGGKWTKAPPSISLAVSNWAVERAGKWCLPSLRGSSRLQ